MTAIMSFVSALRLTVVCLWILRGPSTVAALERHHSRSLMKATSGDATDTPQIGIQVKEYQPSGSTGRKLLKKKYKFKSRRQGGGHDKVTFEITDRFACYLKKEKEFLERLAYVGTVEREEIKSVCRRVAAGDTKFSTDLELDEGEGSIGTGDDIVKGKVSHQFGCTVTDGPEVKINPGFDEGEVFALIKFGRSNNIVDCAEDEEDCNMWTILEDDDLEELLEKAGKKGWGRRLLMGNKVGGLGRGLLMEEPPKKAPIKIAATRQKPTPQQTPPDQDLKIPDTFPQLPKIPDQPPTLTTPAMNPGEYKATDTKVPEGILREPRKPALISFPKKKRKVGGVGMKDDVQVEEIKYTTGYQKDTMGLDQQIAGWIEKFGPDKVNPIVEECKKSTKETSKTTGLNTQGYLRCLNSKIAALSDTDQVKESPEVLKAKREALQAQIEKWKVEYKGQKSFLEGDSFVTLWDAASTHCRRLSYKDEDIDEYRECLDVFLTKKEDYLTGKFNKFNSGLPVDSGAADKKSMARGKKGGN